MIACSAACWSSQVERRADLQAAVVGAVLGDAVRDSTLSSPIAARICGRSQLVKYGAAAGSCGLLDQRRGRERLVLAELVLRLGDVVLLEHVLEDAGRGGPWPPAGGANGSNAVGSATIPASSAASQGSSTDAHGRSRGASPQPEPAWRGRHRRVVAVDLPEVHARGRLDPVGAVSEVDRVQVLGHDLLLRPPAREVIRERRLAQLLEDRAVVLLGQRVLDELLGDRRGALCRAAGHVGR